MKLTVNFETTAALVEWLASLNARQQALMGMTQVATPPPATVTPEKQEAARQSTGKADPPAKFEASGIGELVLEAMKVNVEATKGVLMSNGGVIKGKPNANGLKPEVYEKVIGELKAIIAGKEVVAEVVKTEDAAPITGEPAATPDDPPAPTPVPTYAESGLKEKIQALQQRDGMKPKLMALITELAPADAEGKHKASNIPPDKFKEAHKRLDALAAE